MKSVWLGAALIAALGSAAWALEQIEPVTGRTPVSATVKQAFDEAFGADLKAAQANSDPAALGQLALRIRAEADRRMDSSGEFAAYALDQVVVIASPLAGRQRLVYNALAAQKAAGLRPARACLEKMVQLGPRVAGELSGRPLEAWLTGNWLPDALALGKMQMSENHYGLAWAALAPLKEPLKNSTAPAVAEYRLLLADAEFLRTVEESCAKFDAELKTPGSHTEANLALAAVRIGRDRKPTEAVVFLKAVDDPAAKDLAALLGAGHELAGKDELAAAVALAALAPKAPGAYFQYLLWHEADTHLEHVRSKSDLPDEEVARAETLWDQVGEKMAAVAGGLPARVVAPARHRSICYVVQRSGAMTDCMNGAKGWLTCTIRELKPNAAFYINFYNTGPQELPAHGFLPATEANKQQAGVFIKGVKANGMHDAVGALKRAFDLQPDVIYLVGNNFDEPLAELLAKLNPKKKVIVNTVGVVYSESESMLRDLARNNRGTYRFIDENELKQFEKAAEEAKPQSK